PAIAEVTYGRNCKAGGVEPKQAVVPDIICKPLATPVTNAIRKRGNIWATCLVRRFQASGLPGGERRNCRQTPAADCQVFPETSTLSAPEGQFPDCARHRAMPDVKIGRPFGTAPANRNLIGASVVGLPGIGQRFAERILEPQVQALIHPMLIFRNEG